MNLYAAHIDWLDLSIRSIQDTAGEDEGWVDTRSAELSLLQKAAVELRAEEVRVRSFYLQTLQAAFEEAPMPGWEEQAPRVHGDGEGLPPVDRGAKRRAGA